MEAAHAAAEAERAKDGYSGGKDGSEHISLAGNSGSSGSSGEKSGGGSRAGSSGGGYGVPGDAGQITAPKRYTENVTVWDPDGNMVGGYIEDGKTYLNNGQRIGDGYFVKTVSGDVYTMEGGQGRKASLDELANAKATKQTQNAATKAYEEAESTYKQQMAEAQRQLDLATEASVKQTLNSLGKQKDEVNETMDKAAREAYIAKMQSQRDLAEQYAAAGITGGPTESGRINLENSYSNNITDINNQRRASIDDINSAMADAELTGDITKAQNAANIAQQAANTYLELAQNRIALEREVTKEAQTEAEKQLQYYLTYIDAYADDPQAEIDKLKAQGVSETDPRIMALRALINQQAAEAEALKREEELAKLKYSQKGNGTTTGTTGDANPQTTNAATSATSSSSGLSSWPVEDRAAVKMFTSLHKTYNKQDIENDYKAGFLTEKAYKLLLSALAGNAEDKAKVLEYSK